MSLSSIVSAISSKLQDPAYPDEVIADLINKKLQKVAGGIRMPNGITSPPLSDLYAFGTVNTSTTLPYVSLPDNYQRKVVMVYDSGNVKIAPPKGGDYYAYNLFLRQIDTLNLSEVGSIYRVCVKGDKIYYQGIPTAATTLGLHYYRKPETMSLDGDVPEGLPDHLAEDILKHGVLADIYGEKIEDGQDNSGIATKYHTAKFYEAMTDLIDFIGIDEEPQYYGEDSDEDGAICD